MHHVLNSKPIGWWGKGDFYKTGETDAQRFVDTFFKDNKISPKSRVCLEIGCGAGRVTSALARRFKRVMALDVSDDMLQVASENVDAENVTFVRGNGVDLDVIEKDSVSFVFSTMVFQHIPDVEVQYELLREMARVLRPRGWFFIHLYADQKHYDHISVQWKKRADALDKGAGPSESLMGWEEAALPELEDHSYQTSMCTPVDDPTVRALLDELGLRLVLDEGAGGKRWLIGGQLKA
jgi:ubiquinone/menaquinone biosynthesis C-methylase UbiE